MVSSRWRCRTGYSAHPKYCACWGLDYTQIFTVMVQSSGIKAQKASCGLFFFFSDELCKKKGGCLENVKNTSTLFNMGDSLWSPNGGILFFS
uniref:Uncharacterized protein n=1 Tax=Pyxicephalus adspersus TaxID=30357 RepID=A0AAV2ZUG9_PYXAD|nr:TPA: hypothetical protein GDO54_002994 [Pyxicephalus adspersus]